MTIPAPDHADLVKYHAYMTTHTGKKVDVSNFHPEDVDIRDVAHALALQTRYNGHTKVFYSVAEHCVLVCEMAEVAYGKGSPEARMALLHDAAEAYVGDMPSPIKALLPSFKVLENNVASAIAVALGLPQPDHPSWALVRTLDRQALYLEAAALLVHVPAWVEPVEERFRLSIWCRGPHWAEEAFWAKCRDYGLVPPGEPESHSGNLSTTGPTGSGC